MNATTYLDDATVAQLHDLAAAAKELRGAWGAAARGIGPSSAEQSFEGVEMAKKALKRVDVVKQANGWVAQRRNGKNYATGPTKADVVKRTAKAARSEGGLTVRIHRGNGTIQEERTYPAAADPRRSKG